jgi:WD40 repeat protein
MFLKVFVGVLLFVIPASAQLRRTVPQTVKRSQVRVALSHDGQMLAVARSKDRSARVELFSTATGELHRTIEGFDGPIWSLTFSRDGKSVITVSTEIRDAKIQTSVKDRRQKTIGELKWWDTHSGEFMKKLPLADERVFSLEAAWSPAGDVMALVERSSESYIGADPYRGAFGQRIMVTGWLAIRDLQLKLLDAQTGRRRVKVEDSQQTYQGQFAYLYGRLDHPVFSPDGQLLAAVSGEEVFVWNVATGKKILTVKKMRGLPSAIAFSPDSSVVAVASVKFKNPGAESEISLWNVSTGKSVNTLRGKSDSISCLQFVAGGRLLLIGSLQYGPDTTKGTMKVWDVRDNRLRVIDIHEGGEEGVSSLTMLPDESAVVVQSGPNVELRETRSGNIIFSFAPSEEDETESMRRSRYVVSANRALAVAFSRDGTTVSAEIPGEGVRRWDARTGGVKERIEREQGSETIAISSDGDFLVEATGSGVILTDLVKGTADVAVPATGLISALALSPDGKLLAFGSDDEIELWKVGDKAASITISAGQKITAVAIDASGRLVAAAREDRSIGLWDVKTGALQAELRKHENVVNALAFSPDGKTLASGGDDRTAILWDIPSGKSKRTLKGHDMTVTSLAFSPDGRLLASGSGNSAVVLWVVESGKIDRILR